MVILEISNQKITWPLKIMHFFLPSVAVLNYSFAHAQFVLIMQKLSMYNFEGSYNLGQRSVLILFFVPLTRNPI